MANMLWEGPDPNNKASCPYSIDFVCKPAPAESLSSLESGRLLLTVNLGNGTEVKSATARIVNTAKEENLDKVQGSSPLKRQTFLFSDLVQNGSKPGKWTGEIHIPSSWIEGGTQAYEKTGAAAPKS